MYDAFIVQQRYDYDSDGSLWLEHSRELDSFQDPSVNIYDQTRSYHSIDGKLTVVNRHIGISGVSDETHSGRHQVYQENWYDALGRRVLVRARKSSACNNGTHGDLACKSYVERTVWDGDQILDEKTGIIPCSVAYPAAGSAAGSRYRGNSTPWQAGYRTGYLCGMRLSNTLERFRQQILAVAEANGAISISVFGSVARGEDTPESDVDFLVHLQPGRTLLDLTRLELALEALLGRHVDVLTEESLHESIRSTAIRQAISV